MAVVSEKLLLVLIVVELDNVLFGHSTVFLEMGISVELVLCSGGCTICVFLFDGGDFWILLFTGMIGVWLDDEELVFDDGYFDM